jgi:hypothetical protein
MTLSCKVLLTVSCVSFSLHAMEQGQKLGTLSIANNPSIHIDYTSLIRKLYNKADISLNNYNPTALQSLKDIFEISTQIKELKSKGIATKEFGAFAYEQPFETPFLWDKKTPYHNPHYTSIFLKRIADYNNHIEKDNLPIPTKEEFSRYKNNIKNIASNHQATTDFGLDMNLDEIDPTKKTVIVDLPKEITEGAQALDALIENITNIKNALPHDIKRLAFNLYGPKL